MELPQLVVELVGDYSKLMEDIKRARVEAVKQAQFLEKDLNLTIGVNDDSLKNLNKHFDLKVSHFKQTQAGPKLGSIFSPEKGSKMGPRCAQVIESVLGQLAQNTARI